MATHSSILAGRIPWAERTWRAIAHGVAKSQTRLIDFTSFHFIHFSSSFFQTHHFIARPQIVSLQVPFNNDLNDY